MEEDIEKKTLKADVIDKIKTCYDPEIPVDIYELGLIYDIRIDDKKMVHIIMTLTSPNCPVAGSLPGEVEEKVRAVHGVKDAKVEVVWDPPWSYDMMSEVAKLELGLM
jgi:FeS assembly SUF system protein